MSKKRTIEIVRRNVVAILLTGCLSANAIAQTGYFEGQNASGSIGDVYSQPQLQGHSDSQAYNHRVASHGHHSQYERHESRIKLEEFNIYPTFSMLDDVTGYYTEFEIATKTDLGRWEMENRTVLNVADLPGTIRLGAANPGDVPGSVNFRSNGFGDILSGFFFSRKNSRHQYHFGVGPVVTFPTASNDSLGTSQWTIGPGAHFNTEIRRLTMGFFLWQSWGLTDNPSQKRVNQLFGKPFLIYELNEKWNLVYIPLGMSHSWKSTPGQDWTVPVGGGLRRLFEVHGQKMGLQFQVFDYVRQKKTDPEWEYRFTIEFLFD